MSEKSIWQQITNPRETYTDGYGQQREVHEPQWVSAARNLYNKGKDIYNKVDRRINHGKYLELTDPETGEVYRPQINSGAGLLMDLFDPSGAIGKIDDIVKSLDSFSDIDWAKLTDVQWDNLYSKAIDSGNSNLIQKIRDAHFRVKARKTKVSEPQFHSTNSNFTKFELEHPSETGIPTDAYIHVGTKQAAEDIGGKRMLKLYVNQTNPLWVEDNIQDSPMKIIDAITDAKGLSNNEREQLILEWRNYISEIGWDKKYPAQNEQTRKLLERYGFDGIEYINGTEDVGSISRGLISPSQLKVTDAITHDDAGKIIPISKRDDFINPDMRYGFIPLGIGIALNRDEEQNYKQGGILKSQPGTKLLVPHKDYLGTPYKQDGDYDYFNAHPTNHPTQPGEHWTSRNPTTGQLLKSENHPTFELMMKGEQEANMNVYRDLNGSLYSYPKNQRVPLYLKQFNFGK